MNELITLTGGDDRFPVDCRRLHEGLGVETRYNDWFLRQVDGVFIDGEDFYSSLSKTTEGGRPATNHYCTIGMAKELCVLQRNEKGRMVRRRLIQIEEQRNQPAAVMARALKMADAMITELSGKALLLESKVEADAPKVMFAEAVSASDGSILIGQLAKYLTQNGAKIGQNRLFERLREEGFLCSARGERWNLPTQKAMEMSLFELKMNTMMTPDGPKEVKPTTKVTGKGQIYFLNRYLHLAS